MSNRATRAKHKAIIRSSGATTRSLSDDMGRSFLSSSDRAANRLLEKKASKEPGAAEIAALFTGVGDDNDTRLQAVWFERWGEYPVRNETWIWEGIVGCTVVFRSSDVSSIADQELFEMARERGGKDEMTISRNDEFTFVNHSFIVL